MRSGVTSQILIALASIVCGVLLVVFQSFAVELLIRIFGAVLIVTGIIIALLAFRKHPADRLPNYVGGITLIVIGLILLFAARFLVNLFPFVVGIVMIISGLGDLFMIFDGRPGPKLLHALTAVLVIILGLLVLFHPGFIADIIVMFMGIVLIVNGIVDIIVAIRNRRAGPIDVEYREMPPHDGPGAPPPGYH